MKTNHPESFEIEIDRKKLLRISKRDELSGYFVLLMLIAGLAILCGSKAYFISLYMTFGLWGALLIPGLLTVATAWALAKLLMLIFGNRRAIKFADAYRVLIDGSCLRVVTPRTDHKIHFRQIVDFELLKESPFYTDKVNTIMMRTTVGGQNSMSIKLLAAVNPLRTRDLLAEIDAQRG
ncbi:hypothetical protein [Haloferula sp.]|uniref:hypothetical protein n=1 Tax=Haloferula sp. TaxID=2497595 RepID=UPI00329E7F12